jgi:hypothetical protein
MNQTFQGNALIVLMRIKLRGRFSWWRQLRRSSRQAGAFRSL